jgi:Protein of unknown function (DUF5661)
MKRTFDIDEARDIAESLEIEFAKSGYDLAQFRAGLDVEAEHGAVDPATNVTQDDPLTTGKIALAHLKEMPDYYSRLAKMEAEPAAAPEAASAAPDGSRKRKLAASLVIGLATLASGVIAVLLVRKVRARAG